LPGSDQKKGDRAKNLFDRQKGKKDEEGKRKKKMYHQILD